jgi:two-component system sensor histidine kinase AlgZ
MNPISWARGTLLPYLTAWVVPAAFLSFLLVFQGTLSWRLALLVGVPLAAVHAFICLAAHYVCRAAPLHRTALWRIAGTQFWAAVLSASLLLGAARAWVRFLGYLGWFETAEDSWPLVAPIVFAQATLLFVLVAALHYVLDAIEASRKAETEALHQKLLSRDAELRALRAQIHPHFLFNSLNSINALIGSDTAAARQTCVMLADFLRSSLTLGARERIPLAQEVDMASHLLAIERVRFGERLRGEIQMDAGIEGVLVPPLLLQPLVENAIKHGIGERVEGGVVQLVASRQGERIKIVIENPKDPLAAPRRGAGIGLENVRRRVAAAYGREGRLDVESAPERFRVTLDLPAQASTEGPPG